MPFAIRNHPPPSSLPANRVHADANEPGHDGYFWSFPASDWSTKTERWIFFFATKSYLAYGALSLDFAPCAHQWQKMVRSLRRTTHYHQYILIYSLLMATAVPIRHYFVHREWHQQGLVLSNRCASMLRALMWQASWEHLLHFTDADDYNTNLIQNTWFIILARAQASKRAMVCNDDSVGGSQKNNKRHWPEYCVCRGASWSQRHQRGAKIRIRCFRLLSLRWDAVCVQCAHCVNRQNVDISFFWWAPNM